MTLPFAKRRMMSVYCVLRAPLKIPDFVENIQFFRLAFQDNKARKIIVKICVFFIDRQGAFLYDIIKRKAPFDDFALKGSLLNA